MHVNHATLMDSWKPENWHQTDLGETRCSKPTEFVVFSGGEPYMDTVDSCGPFKMRKVTQNLPDRRKLWKRPLSQHTHTDWQDKLRAALLCHMSSCRWVTLWKRTRRSWCGVWGYIQYSNLLNIKSCLTSAICHTEICSAAYFTQ
jgi:hypothetical protein